MGKKTWIRVEEKLPELYKDVLALIKYKGEYQILHTLRHEDNKEWAIGDCPVIAWMEIPSFKNLIKGE